MKVIDIAVNLTDDLALVLKRAQDVGVIGILATGTSLKSSRQCIQMSNYPGIFCTVGCHPTESQDFEKSNLGPEGYLNALKETVLSNKDKVIAIGETGLDYDRLHFCPADIQKKYFLQQLDLARELNMPLFLHNRNTGMDFVNIMRTHGKGLRGVVHSFTGTYEEMKIITEELNLYIGVNGCSLKTEENLMTVKDIPLDKLMVETDAPWCDIKQSHASHKYLKDYAQLFPTKKKERFQDGEMVKGRNEPCNALQVIEVISQLKNLSKEQVAEALFRNTCQLFPQFNQVTTLI